MCMQCHKYEQKEKQEEKNNTKVALMRSKYIHEQLTHPSP